MDRRNIYIYGAPASGKTTLGRMLAERIGARFVDLDEEIVAKAGRTIPEIFATDGEAAFRDLESGALRSVADAGRKAQMVVSLGGGTLLHYENRSLCEKTGTVFCIDTPSDEERARRIGAAVGTRPLGDKAKERAAHYASFQNRIAAFFEAQESLVVVGRGIASALIAGRSVVADDMVARLWSRRLGIEPFATIPSGEAHKTPATVAGIWSAMSKKGLGRRDCVAALGGGVTGDVVGFAAATWLRGIAWINFPTTLLSMVDASTGGKTGCDLPEGKNLAGAFHFPRLVAIDVDFLETLSPRLLADGRAEMIKHEIISGLRAAGMQKPCTLNSMPEPRDIAENLLVKVGIVREDPFETKGWRILLNCGHTVGHAIEKATGYFVSHGEAVAIGCVEEARIAVRRGLAPSSWPDELAARFAKAGLPTEMPNGLSFASLVPLMRGDKKRDGDSVVFALPCGWGDVRGVRLDLSSDV